MITKEELIKIILDAAKDTPECCPFCFADTRPRYDCKNCGYDHRGSKCLRKGKHEDSCIVVRLSNPEFIHKLKKLKK